MNQIKKPLSVAVVDFKNDLIQVINYAIRIDGVPHFCVERILQDILAEVTPIVDQEYKTDLHAYQAALEQMKEIQPAPNEEVINEIVEEIEKSED